MPIILSQRIDVESEYDDIPFVRYHYPKRYRNQICEGDLFLYYQGDRSKKENRYYFGIGVVGNIELASDDNHYYAQIMAARPFSKRVPIYHPEGGFYESIDFASVRKKENPAWQNSIRRISEGAFEAIVRAAGLETSAFCAISMVEQENNPINVLHLLNKRYKDALPEKREKVVSTYLDRGRAVTQVLKNILGATCQICGKHGFQKKDGGYYIEAHHLVQIAQEVPDSLCTDNIILVCPNCHRELHFGKNVIAEDCGSAVKISIGNNKPTRINKNTVDYLISLRLSQ